MLRRGLRLPLSLERAGGRIAPLPTGQAPQVEKRSTWRILLVASRAATLYDSASVG